MVVHTLHAWGLEPNLPEGRSCEKDEENGRIIILGYIKEVLTGIFNAAGRNLFHREKNIAHL